jgi:hypothetical protein
MIQTETGKKYCSTRCGQAASVNRRRARQNTPLEEAITNSTRYTLKKLMLSASYLSDAYKFDREEVEEMLVRDMERRLDEFWDAEK